ncbi:MAG: S26 family signal peptidase [Candidatus Thermoplasmatota archaeon]|nr:S26 family signal peptidase [Candidatus Thermoplasmatota archaeon]
MNSKHLEIAAVIAVIAIFAGLTLYSGMFPPLSVVESESMEHSNNWEYGVINTGDIVFQKKVTDPLKNVITYVQGKEANFSTYGEYGNVILYRSTYGLTVIHRAILYLEWKNGTAYVPGESNAPWMTVTNQYILIRDLGFSHRNFIVYISHYQNQSGYITMGDHNFAYINDSEYYNKSLNAWALSDLSIGIDSGPVSQSRVIAIAFGQIPWLGLVKLNIMRIYGGWQYYNEVPHGSYEGLFSVLAIIVFLGLFPYRRVFGHRKR